MRLMAIKHDSVDLILPALNNIQWRVDVIK
jgi:hypothetical protein